MKKLLLFMLGVLIALPAFARDFKYNYEGQTIIYTVIDEEAKTCKTKEGEFTSPGNKVKGKLVLPAHPNDGDKEYTLTKIGSYSFHDNDELTEIIIPNSVTEIGSDAFSHSSGLTEIIIPNSVTVIGNGAFGTCVNLTEVIIPNSVTKIGSRAFSTCCDLTEVIIPNSVTEFGEDVFWGCELSKLAYPNTIENPYGSKGIQYPAENAVIEDGIIYNSEKTKIYYATIKLEGEFTIPNSITEIGEKTFYYCSGLTEVIIPNSVTYIGEEAFYYCSGLTEVIIPNSVTYIGEEAFYYCSGLTEVIIPNSVTYIGENAFQSSGLTEVIIPNSVTYIGEEAFRYCYNLKKSAFPNTISNPFFQGINVQYPAENAVVEDGIIYNSEKTKIYYASLKLEGELTIPNSVENIGENAFYGCSGLTKMTIPNSVTEIGEKAFRSCSGLYEVVAVSEVPAKIANSSFEGLYGSTTLSVPKGSVDYYLVTNWSMFKNLQEGDRAIKYTTYSDDILTYRLFPAADTSEQNKAIVIAGDYKSLTEVSIPERFTYSVDDTRYYVTAVGYGAFRDCEDLSSINFNNRNKATLIGDYAFTNTGISTIELPSTVESIGNYAFKGCKNLNTIELPSTIESIGNYAFKGCKNLNSINIPEKVRELGNSAFSECSSLSEISIPASVEKIGNSAFANCYSLNSLTLNEGLEYIGNKAFNNCTSISEVSIPASVGQIGDGAFALCSNLNSVTLNEGLEYIGNEAFSSCSSLPEISIPASVNIIGENAFYNSGLAKVTTPSLENWSAIEFANEFSNPVSIAKGLWLKGHSDPITDLVIPEGVERVADYAFIHCESIMTISLPNTLQTIGDKAFACLSGINTLILPNSLEEIGLEAFYNCSSLSDITIGTSLKSCNSNHFTGCNLDRITIADGSDKLVIEGSWDNFSISDLYMGRQIEFK